MKNISYSHNILEQKLDTLGEDYNRDGRNRYIELSCGNSILNGKETRIYSTGSTLTKPSSIIKKFIKCVNDDINISFITGKSKDESISTINKIQNILKNPYLSSKYYGNRIVLYQTSERFMNKKNYSVLRPKSDNYYWSVPKNLSNEKDCYIRYKRKSDSEDLFNIPIVEPYSDIFELNKSRFPYTLEYKKDIDKFELDSPDDTEYYDNMKEIRDSFYHIHKPIVSYMYNDRKYKEKMNNITLFVVDNDNLYKTEIQTFQKV